MKPFVILALPRTGTKMIADAISSHPDIPNVIHEFSGSESDFWDHPAVLSNAVRDWFDQVTVIHVYRHNAIEGARSFLMLGYRFPDGAQELSAKEVSDKAKWRQERDSELASHADWSVSYEQLTNGAEITELPQWFSDKFCELVGVDKRRLTTTIKKDQRVILKNEGEISGLAFS